MVVSPPTTPFVAVQYKSKIKMKIASSALRARCNLVLLPVHHFPKMWDVDVLVASLVLATSISGEFSQRSCFSNAVLLISSTVTTSLWAVDWRLFQECVLMNLFIQKVYLIVQKNIFFHTLKVPSPSFPLSHEHFLPLLFRVHRLSLQKSQLNSCITYLSKTIDFPTCVFRRKSDNFGWAILFYRFTIS